MNYVQQPQTLLNKAGKSELFSLKYNMLQPQGTSTKSAKKRLNFKNPASLKIKIISISYFFVDAITPLK